MENKQTAVECLKEKLMYLDFHPNTLVDVLQWIEQAKQMEKQQIIEAHLNGFADAHDWPHKRTAHEYYNETYGNNSTL